MLCFRLAPFFELGVCPHAPASSASGVLAPGLGCGLLCRPPLCRAGLPLGALAAAGPGSAVGLALFGRRTRVRGVAFCCLPIVALRCSLWAARRRRAWVRGWQRLLGRRARVRGGGAGCGAGGAVCRAVLGVGLCRTRVRRCRFFPFRRARVRGHGVLVLRAVNHSVFNQPCACSFPKKGPGPRAPGPARIRFDISRL